jgi:hypothetical protein
MDAVDLGNIDGYNNSSGLGEDDNEAVTYMNFLIDEENTKEV